MKNKHSPAVILFVFGLLWGGAQSLQAQGTAFTYQGRLTSQGNALNGSYEMRFGVWSAQANGSQLGMTLTNAPVTVANGLFTALLDFGGGVFTGPARWLEIGVRTNGDSGPFRTLSGRQLLTPSPYAMYSPQAGTVPWSGITGTPAGFADGVDNDTTYSAGSGLGLVGTQFSVNYAGSGSAATASRSDHNHHGQIWSGTNFDGLFVTTLATNGNGLHGVANRGDRAYGVFGEAFDGFGLVGSGGYGGIWAYSSNGWAMLAQSSGGLVAPQIKVVQETTSEYCRIRLAVHPYADGEWDMAVSPGTNSTYNLAFRGTNVVTVSPGGTITALSFVPTSDRNLKQDFAPVDGRSILERVAALPIQTWKFKEESETRHIGPMAQDFHSAFNVGPDDRHIATVDADGVALAAIQGLNEIVREKEARIEALEKTVAELKALVGELAEKQSNHR